MELLRWLKRKEIWSFAFLNWRMWNVFVRKIKVLQLLTIIMMILALLSLNYHIHMFNKRKKKRLISYKKRKIKIFFIWVTIIRHNFLICIFFRIFKISIVDVFGGDCCGFFLKIIFMEVWLLSFFCAAHVHVGNSYNLQMRSYDVENPVKWLFVEQLDRSTQSIRVQVKKFKQWNHRSSHAARFMCIYKLWLGILQST